MLFIMYLTLQFIISIPSIELYLRILHFFSPFRNLRFDNIDFQSIVIPLVLDLFRQPPFLQITHLLLLLFLYLPLLQYLLLLNFKIIHEHPIIL